MMNMDTKHCQPVSSSSFASTLRGSASGRRPERALNAKTRFAIMDMICASLIGAQPSIKLAKTQSLRCDHVDAGAAEQ